MSSSFLQLAFGQRMTYCEIFTISNADCLVMKKIGNWLLIKPILIDKKIWIDFFICLNCTLFVDLFTTINPFLKI
jgi:hypothetical protein